MKKYEKYKDCTIAGVPQIPEGWTISKVKYLADPKIENSFADGDWIESPFVTKEGIRYLTSGNIGDGVFKRQGNGHISEETFKKLNCKYAYPGDLVFCRLNSPYGRSCILPEDEEKYVIAVDNVILRTEQNKSYICYQTQCKSFQLEVENEASGATMKRISRSKLGDISIVLPTVQEQNTIAAFLDYKTGKIDSLVSLLSDRIEDLKKYRQAVISETVTHGLDKSAKMKDSGVDWIGVIPQTWRILRFKYVASVKSNLVHPVDFYEYPQVSPDCIEKNTGKLLNYQSVKESGVISDNHLFFKGQIVYSKIRPNLNKVIIAPFDGLCSADMYPIETNQNSQFFFWLMLSDLFVSQVSEVIMSRVKMPKINTEELGEIIMTVPPLSEQQAIADYLDRKTKQIDDCIAATEQRIEDLQKYRTSLIYEAVTGQIDVRDWA